MATKEATVYVVDVGPAMAGRNNGRTQSDSEIAIGYVADKMAGMVATERKTLSIGIVAFNTADSNNPLSIPTAVKGRHDDGDGYDHISIVRPLGQAHLADLRMVGGNLQPDRSGGAADCVSAIVVGMNMIATFCRNLKFIRRIVVVTNGKSGRAIDESNLTDIAAKLTEDSISLTVLGIDFASSDQIAKASSTNVVERVLSQLCNLTSDGMYATMAEALEQLSSRPTLRTVRPVPSYSGPLTLGDPSTENKVSIMVERYARVVSEKLPTASSYVVADVNQDQKTDETTKSIAALAIGHPNHLTAVKQIRTYTVKDSHAVDGVCEVPFEDLAKGFEYGRSIVHISESDMAVVQFATTASFAIVGFIPQENLPPYYSLSSTHAIVPSRSELKSHIGFSALVQALWESSSIAIGRLVTKDGKPPILVALTPSINPADGMDGNGDGGGRYLIESDLPFSEDIRLYPFPPLDRLYTGAKEEDEKDERGSFELNNSIATNTIGAPIPTDQSDPISTLFPSLSAGNDTESIRKHYIPTPALNTAMEAYIDLMTNEETDSSKPEDSLQMSSFPELNESFNPLLHTVRAAIRQRAIDPTCRLESITSVPSFGIKLDHPDETLIGRSNVALDNLIRLANVTKVPPKDKTNAFKYKKDDTEPNANLVLADLGIGDSDMFD